MATNTTPVYTVPLECMCVRATVRVCVSANQAEALTELLKTHCTNLHVQLLTALT